MSLMQRGRPGIGHVTEEHNNAGSDNAELKHFLRENKTPISSWDVLFLLLFACISCLSAELATGCSHFILSNSLPHPACGSQHALTIRTEHGKTPLETHPLPHDASNKQLECSTVGSTSGIFSPYLVIDSQRSSDSQKAPWHAFYQLHTKHGKGGIGVASSMDQGANWEPLGTVLEGHHSLASPWVAYDAGNDNYIMLPALQGPRQSGAVDLYTTSKQAFPFGWQRQGPKLQEGPDLHGNGPDRFEDAAAVYFDNRWWIFVSMKEQDPSIHHTLRLFLATNLTRTWEEHPASPISHDQRYARNGGRPLVIEGVLHRWAQDCSSLAGRALHLLKLDLSPTTYSESWVATKQAGTDRSHRGWNQLHHIDMQQAVVNGEWVGLVSGAPGRPGLPAILGGHSLHQQQRQQQLGANALGIESWLHWLRNTLVVVLLVLWVTRTFMPGHNHHNGARSSTQRLPPRSSFQLEILLLGGAELGKKSDGGHQSVHAARASHVRSLASRVWSLPNIQLGMLLLTAFSCATLLFLAAPQNLQCPRWAVKVNILPSPAGGHTDPAAPFFPVSPPPGSILVVSAANAPFFDRLQNMVPSVQAWAPGQKVAIYDLGFTRQQLLDMACWQDVEVQPFPFAKYPPHVRDLRNYAFKALVIQEALLLSRVVLWIDAGLELRAPMHTMQSWLSQHGHVGALQEDNIGDDMYIKTKDMVDEMGLSRFWPQASKWQFCAGGLQGFVRGSDAERLILHPVINCSLRASCIAPPGASRLNHNFDQTAFTLATRASNYTCLPRETHCMWSTKKAPRAAMQPSYPIEVISRGHRLPKPYVPFLKRRPSCSPTEEQLVPWASKAPSEPPPWNRYSFGFRVQKIWLQPIGDLIVQAGSCLDVHYLAHIIFWVLCAAVWGGLLGCRALHHNWHAASHKRMAVLVTMAAMAAVALQTTLLDFFGRVR